MLPGITVLLTIHVLNGLNGIHITASIIMMQKLKHATRLAIILFLLTLQLEPKQILIVGMINVV